MKKLQEKWVEFFKAFFSPWFVLAGIITAASIILSIIFKNNQLFSNLLTVIGGITGGIAGSIFQNEYNKNVGQEILEKKGQSAVRNLQSIQKQINSLKGWVFGFFKKSTGESKSQLEEIYRHILTMELSVNSGYEDWIDIIPQLSQEKKEQEKILEKYKEISKTLVDELFEQKMKLYKAANVKEKEELGKKISQLEKQIRNWKNVNSAVTVSAPLTMGVSSVGMVDDPSFRGLSSMRTCIGCGKKFSQSLSDLSFGFTTTFYCQECLNSRYKNNSKISL